MNTQGNKLVRYLTEAKAELTRVTWPTRNEILKSTLIVISVSIGLAAFLGGLDFGLNKLLEILVSGQNQA